MITGYDGLIVGKLYAVGQGPPQEYTNVSCYNQNKTCSVNCILFNHHTKSCEYKISLKGDAYREIDNLIGFPSSTQHPLVEQPAEKQVKRGGLEDMHPTVSTSPPLPMTPKDDVTVFPSSPSTSRGIEPAPEKESLVVDEDDVSLSHPNVHENILSSSQRDLDYIKSQIDAMYSEIEKEKEEHKNEVKKKYESW